MHKLTIFILLAILVFVIAGSAVYTSLSKGVGNKVSDSGDAAPNTVVMPLETEESPSPNINWEGTSISIEVEQLILPESHPEFPLDTAWVVVEGENLPIEVPIPLAIPENWQGRYAIRIEGNAAYYDYIVDPSMTAKLFSIAALTETGWQAIQDEPHGEAIFTYSGIVWVYNPSLENPFSGEMAEEYSMMVGEAYEVARGLPGFFRPIISQETTLPVLQAYFDTLGAGNYAEAARIFGGDFEVLVSNNLDIPPDDYAALFERACTINGFMCNLKLGEIVRVEQVSEAAVQFTLTLQNPDGSPFELGPCCGTDPATTPVQTEFAFTVEFQDGLFKVLELPVYMP